MLSDFCEFLFWDSIVRILFVTGEVILWAVTLGRHTIRWTEDGYPGAVAETTRVRMTRVLGILLGTVFWAALITLVVVVLADPLWA